MIPFRHRSFSFDTLLAPGEVVTRLVAATEPIQWFWKSTRTLQGKVSADRFEVLRVPSYHNSFAPLIRGNIQPSPTGTRVEGTMFLHPIVVVFLMAYSGFCLLIGFFLTVAKIAQGTWEVLHLLPFGLFLCGWVLALVCFAIESHIALGDLQRVAGVGEVPVCSATQNENDR